jgi:hypothetical protein
MMLDHIVAFAGLFHKKGAHICSAALAATPRYPARLYPIQLAPALAMIKAPFRTSELVFSIGVFG